MSKEKINKKLAIITLKFEDQATKNLSQIANRQLPFIVAKSLTNMAQSAQRGSKETYQGRVSYSQEIRWI